jgi:tetratricopeptide (TPR) repeat protein
MKNERQKYHLFMDEAGKFEGTGEVAKQEKPIIFGLLIPDNLLPELTTKLEHIGNDLDFKGFVHATDEHDNSRFPSYLKQLQKIATHNEIFSFVLHYEQDLLPHASPEQREIYAANRYQAMTQAVFEYLLYLNPRFFGQNIEIYFHPNSRVFRASVAMVEDYKKMGLDVFQPDRGKDLFLVSVLKPEWLQVTLQKLAIQYSPWQQQVGQRKWGILETPQANLCQNHRSPRYPGKLNCCFINLVDNLAWLLRTGSTYKPYINTSNRFTSNISVNIIYGNNLLKYQQLYRSFLSRDFTFFIPESLHLLSKKTYPFKQQVGLLLAKAIRRIKPENIGDVHIIEKQIKNYLGSSGGNWEFVNKLLGVMFEAVSKLDERSKTPENTKLLWSLYSHKVSIHNHRGEFTQALDAYYEAKDLDISPLDVVEYRERVAIENRLAVSVANVFSFHEGIDLLKPLLSSLEESLQPLSDQAGLLLTDSLIGKLRGTLGQNYAFLALSNPKYFEKAEGLFIKAAQEFSSDADKLRHDINFFHLYTDWKKSDMAQACIDEIISSETLAPFLTVQNSETAKGVQFALLAYIKHSFITKQNFKQLVAIFPLQQMKDLFVGAVSEHPFQFICSYLGRMAMSLGEYRKASSLFDHALSIPSQGKRKEQPTLEAIRAQILVLQALGLVNEYRDEAQEKVENAITIMERIGTNPDFHPMLEIRSNDVTGWFAQGWQDLISINWQEDFNHDACQTFLDCFTFNYH